MRLYKKLVSNKYIFYKQSAFSKVYTIYKINIIIIYCFAYNTFEYKIFTKKIFAFASVGLKRISIYLYFSKNIFNISKLNIFKLKFRLIQLI